jgi:uracil DNA glycosylase
VKDIKNELKRVLVPYWFEVLYPIIVNLKNYEYFLMDENRFYPDFINRFNAVNNIDFNNDVQIVVFGQDPYPRKESAIGYAFWDGKIVSWDSPLSPSFRNIIKSILINENLVNRESKIKEIRDIIKKNNIFSPDDFFRNSIKKGVIWLNASLTFEAKSQKILNKHLNFWEPIVEVIIDKILTGSKNVIFVFWGAKSLKLKKYISRTKYNNYYFIYNCHPMLEKFHSKNSFEEIDKILMFLGKDKFSWLN